MDYSLYYMIMYIGNYYYVNELSVCKDIIYRDIYYSISQYPHNVKDNDK